MNAYMHIRNIVMVLAGVAALLAKSWFRDALGGLAHSYLGNISASFSVYFIISIGMTHKARRLLIAAISLAIVEAFELTDGFGVMTNVYDPFDYFANVLGVALASAVDLLSARLMQARLRGADLHNAA